MRSPTVRFPSPQGTRMGVELNTTWILISLYLSLSLSLGMAGREWVCQLPLVSSSLPLLLGMLGRSTSACLILGE